MLLNQCDGCIKSKKLWLISMKAHQVLLKRLQITVDRKCPLTIVSEDFDPMTKSPIVCQFDSYDRSDLLIFELDRDLWESCCVLYQCLCRYGVLEQLPKMYQGLNKLDWKQVSFTSLKRSLLELFATLNSKRSLNQSTSRPLSFITDTIYGKIQYLLERGKSKTHLDKRPERRLAPHSSINTIRIMSPSPNSPPSYLASPHRLFSTRSFSPDSSSRKKENLRLMIKEMQIDSNILRTSLLPSPSESHASDGDSPMVHKQFRFDETTEYLK